MYLCLSIVKTKAREENFYLVWIMFQILHCPPLHFLRMRGWGGGKKGGGKEKKNLSFISLQCFKLSCSSSVIALVLQSPVIIRLVIVYFILQIIVCALYLCIILVNIIYYILLCFVIYLWIKVNQEIFLLTLFKGCVKLWVSIVAK